MSQSGLGSKACSAGVDLGICCDREKRDKSPQFCRRSSQGVMDRNSPGAHMGQRSLSPWFCVVPARSWVLEEIPHHSHEQPGLCLPGENEKNRARQRPGTGEIKTNRKDFLAVLETTLRATSLVTAPVCGDGMRTRAP